MKIIRKVYSEVIKAPTGPATIRLIWPLAIAPARISSLLKKPAVISGSADSAAPPTEEADVYQRNRFAQAAHLEDVLFVMAGQNDRTRRQEQQRFKERVSHQVENRRVPCLHAQREEHVANLAHGRVGENAFDIGLHQRGEARQHRG